MTLTTLVFSGSQVALIVRGKLSAAHEPDLMEQHADCVLSNGTPIGFYGEGNHGSSAGGSSGIDKSSRKSAASFNSTGFGMSGVVYEYAELARFRANYVDAAIARGTGSICTMLVVTVSNAEAQAFDEAWSEMKKDPGSFHIVGANCSSHASQAFQKSGILAGGIPGLDTPNNLYRQLSTEKAAKVTTYSGYAGFLPAGAGFSVTISS